MSRWLDRAEQLTYEGEEITETVEAGAGGVVVTSHRVLVFSPEGDGEAFSHVDLPNVGGVEALEAGEPRWLYLAGQAGVVGAILLLAGAVLPLDAMIGDVEIGRGASALGVGGVVGVIDTILGLLRNLDTILLVLGALAFLIAAGALGWYLTTREHELRIERAGEDPLTLPTGDEGVPESVVQRLRRAIRPEPGE